MTFFQIMSDLRLAEYPRAMYVFSNSYDNIKFFLGPLDILL